MHLLCAYCQCAVCLPTGKAYDKVKERGQQKKLALIRSKARKYFKGLERIGLRATSLTVQKEIGGANMSIKLQNRKRQVIRNRNVTDADIKKALLHALMKNNVSFTTYHEIASLFPSMPKTYEVGIYCCTFIILQ